MQETYFISLSSGSNGNCYYIGNSNEGILIDAGIAPRTIRKRLKDAGIAFESIMALFITHDHYDHIKGAGTLAEKFHIPVFTTKKILDGMNHSHGMTEKIYTYGRLIEKESPVSIGNFKICPFHTSHDGSDNVGYSIYFKNKQLTIATDMGCITEEASRHIHTANYLVIESNYDETMLSEGRYPAHLKQRIKSKKGHLSNYDAACFLSENYQEHLSHIYLCHLSKDNNHPDLAYQTIAMKLEEKGILVGKNVFLEPLPRNQSSKLFVF